MKAMLAEVMNVEANDISSTATFAQLGMDSLTGLRFARKIKDAFGIEIELEWIFDYPTIEQLAGYLDTHPALQGRAAA